MIRSYPVHLVTNILHPPGLHEVRWDVCEQWHRWCSCYLHVHVDKKRVYPLHQNYRKVWWAMWWFVLMVIIVCVHYHGDLCVWFTLVMCVVVLVVEVSEVKVWELSSRPVAGSESTWLWDINTWNHYMNPYRSVIEKFLLKKPEVSQTDDHW